MSGSHCSRSVESSGGAPMRWTHTARARTTADECKRAGAYEIAAGTNRLTLV
jgi:hypothetical protein